MKANFKLIPAVTLAALLTVGSLAQASTTGAGKYDGRIQSSVTQKLDKKSEFKNIASTTEDGIVTLTGSVDTLKDKVDAEKQARKSDKEVKGVRDLIEVSGANLPDAELQKKLSKKILYDRVGYRDTAFNFVTVNVSNGVVTLGGVAAEYMAANDAAAIAQNMEGVKDVVNNIKVLPLSGMDNDLRWRLYRVIYGDNVLSKYGADPARPIRIVVNGGQIGLFGQVDSTMDKNIAGIRAQQVFGGFTVENHLTTPNQVVAR